MNGVAIQRVLTDSPAFVFHDRNPGAIFLGPFRTRIDIEHVEIETAAYQGQEFFNENFAQVTSGP